MGEEEDFVLNAMGYGEPVKVLEDGGDVLMGACVGEEAGG